MLNKLYRSWILWRYREVGLHYGEALSYLPIMGPCVGFDYLVSRFESLEQKVAKLGYEPIELSDFVNAGGYGVPLPEIVLKNKS